MFHVLPYGETTPRTDIHLVSSESNRPLDDAGQSEASATLSDFDTGVLVGLLVGEGHFGGDGRQPQITLRMHTDHAALFAWLTTRFPESRLYGPYDHSGRRYYQWMARGSFLRERLIPLLDRFLTPDHSGRVYERYVRMKQRYGISSTPDHEREPLVAAPSSEGSGAGAAEG